MRWTAYFFLVIILAACNDSPTIPENFDYGKIENNVYKNEYFGFELPVPADWAVENKEQTQQIQEEGRKIIGEHNKELAERIKADNVRSAMLLSVFRYKDDSVVGKYNPSFGIAVENLGKSSRIKNGEDYLKQAKALMQQSGISYTFGTGFISQKLGNKEFTVMELTALYKGDFKVGQLYYATIEKGFAISVIASFGDDEQKDKLKEILANIRFK
jgi:hypothetical protein